MKVTIWNENVHEQREPEILTWYPGGIHETVARFIKDMPGVELVRTATLQMPDCGLPQDVLEDTDVLFWWGHMAHKDVPDELVERVYERVIRGMGLVVMHSAHLSKVFKRVLGCTGSLRWVDNTYGRIHTVMPSHPIAKGIPEHWELGIEETYGEPFGIPQPDELIFIGWFDSGEVFRSGCAWYRGNGKIFYFQPGHETNQSFNHPLVRKVLQNACQWVAPCNVVPKERSIWACPEISQTFERKTFEEILKEY